LKNLSNYFGKKQELNDEDDQEETKDITHSNTEPKKSVKSKNTIKPSEQKLIKDDKSNVTVKTVKEKPSRKTIKKDQQTILQSFDKINIGKKRLFSETGMVVENNLITKRIKK
jgi:hypothetical protein